MAVDVIVAVIGAAGVIIAALIAAHSGHAKTAPTPPASPARTPAVRIGKHLSGGKPIDLLRYYPTTGLMGDTGDLTTAVEPGNHLIRMTYEASGRGPHEWDYKYIDGKVNPSPCKFAGVMLLDGDWGRTPGAGYDLRGATTISWEARSLSGNVYVSFVAGGVNWDWDDKTGTKVRAPYPDSLPRLQLGEPELTGQWKDFEYPLGKNASAAGLQAVVAPFGWVISLDSNQGNHGQPARFVIEVRNISVR